MTASQEWCGNPNAKPLMADGIGIAVVPLNSGECGKNDFGFTKSWSYSWSESLKFTQHTILLTRISSSQGVGFQVVLSNLLWEHAHEFAITKGTSAEHQGNYDIIVVFMIPGNGNRHAEPQPARR